MKDQPNLWDQVLKEANINDQYKESNLLLLGKKNSGKRTLINTMLSNIASQTEDQQNNNRLGNKGLASAIEFTYLTVSNPEDPENDSSISKINVWTLDELSLHDLLSLCITEETIERLMVAICVDLSEPWQALKTILEWTTCVCDRLNEVFQTLNLKTQDKLKLNQRKYMQSYEVPKYDVDGKLVKFNAKQDKKEGEEDEIEVPLSSELLQINYGVPFMFLCTKADALEAFEKDPEYDKKLDLLQYTLRKMALQYGATVLYTSNKQNINMDILYDYIIHRFYGFGLKYNPEVIHKDSVFVPSGYDKEVLIRETFPNLNEDVQFEDYFPEPTIKKTAANQEIVVEDYQQFLVKLREKLGSTQTKDTGIKKNDSDPSDQKTAIPNRESNPTQFFETLKVRNSIKSTTPLLTASQSVNFTEAEKKKPPQSMGGITNGTTEEKQQTTQSTSITNANSSQSSNAQNQKTQSLLNLLKKK